MKTPNANLQGCLLVAFNLFWVRDPLRIGGKVKNVPLEKCTFPHAHEICIQCRGLWSSVKPAHCPLSVLEIQAAQMTLLQFFPGQCLTELQQQKNKADLKWCPFFSLPFVRRCQNQDIKTALRSWERQKLNNPVFIGSLWGNGKWLN